ncbi:MAG TPA: hypothetical protein VEG26_07565 [Steroidobacteraceae bacterium]|nr:hypothetical protein [Steroidobacteraceae bacterium]
MSASPVSPPRVPWAAVAVSGLLGGALDLLFAFIFYGYQGAGAGVIVRSIASGVLGPESFSAGGWVLGLGTALHFFIAVSAAFVFYLASRTLTVLLRRPVLCGAVFGVAMYVFMHQVVLPLSRVHHRVMPLSDVVGELISHIFLFGIVIALGVARAVTAAGRRP